MICFSLIFYKGLKRSKTYYLLLVICYLINNSPQAINKEKTTAAIACLPNSNKANQEDFSRIMVNRVTKQGSRVSASKCDRKMG